MRPFASSARTGGTFWSTTTAPALTFSTSPASTPTAAALHRRQRRLGMMLRSLWVHAGPGGAGQGVAKQRSAVGSRRVEPRRSVAGVVGCGIMSYIQPHSAGALAPGPGAGGRSLVVLRMYCGGRGSFLPCGDLMSATTAWIGLRRCMRRLKPVWLQGIITLRLRLRRVPMQNLGGQLRTRSCMWRCVCVCVCVYVCVCVCVCVYKQVRFSGRGRAHHSKCTYVPGGARAGHGDAGAQLPWRRSHGLIRH